MLLLIFSQPGVSEFTREWNWLDRHAYLLITGFFTRNANILRSIHGTHDNHRHGHVGILKTVCVVGEYSCEIIRKIKLKRSLDIRKTQGGICIIAIYSLGNLDKSLVSVLNNSVCLLDIQLHFFILLLLKSSISSLLNTYHLLCVRSYCKHFSSVNPLLVLIVFSAILEFRALNLKHSLASLQI